MSSSTGSYSSYQSFSRHTGSNPASHVPDPRLTILPPAILKDARVLDIGCNNGAVAGHLLLRHSINSLSGVDVSEDLIRKARSHVRFMLSRIRPPRPGQREGKEEWFPISSVLAHGSRAVDPESGSRCRFWVADWVTDAPTSSEYDVVLALSVIKWAHLAHGDAGLRSFFERVFGALARGGWFVLEPQDWTSYARAVKKNPELRSAYEAIRVRPEEFVRVVEDVGFVLVRRWGGGEDGLRREVLLFRKGE